MPVLILSNIELFPIEHSKGITHEGILVALEVEFILLKNIYIYLRIINLSRILR